MFTKFRYNITLEFSIFVRIFFSLSLALLIKSCRRKALLTRDKWLISECRSFSLLFVVFVTKLPQNSLSPWICHLQIIFYFHEKFRGAEKSFSFSLCLRHQKGKRRICEGWGWGVQSANSLRPSPVMEWGRKTSRPQSQTRSQLTYQNLSNWRSRNN